VVDAERPTKRIHVQPWGKRLKCKKENHFASMCKTQDQIVHEVSDNPYQVSDSLFVESVSEDVNQINQVFVDIKIGNKKIPVSFKILGPK